MMNAIPDTLDSLVLRTDFSDEPAWQSICAAIEQPVGDFKAYVSFLSEPSYAGISVEQVLSLIPQDYPRSFLFIVDTLTLSSSEQRILVVDLYDAPGRSFRVIPSEAWSVENNLSIANMDFAEFAEVVDHDGVFRGFSAY